MREKLIELRKKRGYTQEQLAKKLNLGRSTYSGYELGYFNPTLEKALQLKKILNYKNDDIFLCTDDSKMDKE